MKTKQILPVLLIMLFAVTGSLSGFGQAAGQDPWIQEQLMAPADLAKIINDPNAKKPLVYCVGPSANIKNSIDMGPAHEPENLNKLKQALGKLSKDADIVIYCGCCPFDHCPNIRPAFSLLKEMGFKNAKLLNLSTNIKVDWLNKGYPKNE